jgi:hypothetical protein
MLIRISFPKQGTHFHGLDTITDRNMKTINDVFQDLVQGVTWPVSLTMGYWIAT